MLMDHTKSKSDVPLRPEAKAMHNQKMLVFRFVGMPRLEPPAEQFIVLHHGSAILHRRRWLLDSGNGSNMNAIQCQTII